MSADLDIPRLNQVESMGGLIFATEMLAPAGPELLGALGKPQSMLFVQFLGKAMAGQGFEVVGVGHGFASGGQLSFSRMAAISCVTSIPTGHQVMQRPQPTQPDRSN